MTVLFLDPSSGHAHADWQGQGQFTSALSAAQMHAFGRVHPGGSMLSAQQMAGWRQDAMSHSLNEHLRGAGRHLDHEALIGGLRSANFAANGEEMRLDSALVDASGNFRADAFGDNPGAAMARALDFMHAEVLTEDHALPTAYDAFAAGSGIPLGARTHTVHLRTRSGQANWYRGQGLDVGRVSFAMEEAQFPVHYIVTSVEVNLFDALSQQFAGVNEQADKLRDARDIIEQFHGEALWLGDDRVGFYGVKNYPVQARRVSAVAFDGSASAEDVLAELNFMANYAYVNSKQVYRPNRMRTTARVRRYLAETRLNTAGGDRTILEAFLRTQPLISDIEVSHELEDFNGSGVDGIYVYNDSPRAINYETVGGGIQVLPPQASGYSTTTFLWMAVGGIVQRKPGNQLMTEVVASS